MNNPYFGQYPFPMQMPMQPQPVQQLQQVQNIGIPGKFVNDFNEISAADIPMNTPAIFAKNDRSEIQLREWDSNGQIKPTLYRVVAEEPAAPPRLFDPRELLDPIFVRLSELEDKIDKFSKPTASSKSRKESEVDGH